MFVLRSIPKRVVGLGLASFGRTRARSRRVSRERTRSRFHLEGLEDRCLLSGISGFAEFPVPSANIATDGITAGPDGNLWFVERSTGKIGQINPTTDVITKYTVPYSKSAPQGITAGHHGNLWFTDNGTSAIGVATLASAPLMVTQQPPASVTAGNGFGLTVQDVDASGLSGALTNIVNVTRRSPSNSLSTPARIAAPDPLLAPLVLDSPDLWDGLRLKKHARSI